MSFLLNWLSGAQGAASNAGNYYQNAMNNEINASGSPAARIFTQEQASALNPQFQDQTQNLAGSEAAMGILGSGAGQQGFDLLGSNQAATLAGAVAPLYQGALNAYSGINSQMPGAQLGAYNTANEQTLQGLQGLGSLAGEFFGLPGSTGAGGQGNPATGTTTQTYSQNTGSYNPYANYGGGNQTG